MDNDVINYQTRFSKQKDFNETARRNASKQNKEKTKSLKCISDLHSIGSTCPLGKQSRHNTDFVKF